jgi:hypothetical protein
VKDEDKAKERLKKELGELRQRFIDIELKECLEHRKRLEGELEKCTRDLRERIKELNLLLGISKLIEERDFSLEELLQGSVDLIPSAYYYPEITCARIIFKGKEFRTENFRETPWKQTSEIRVHGKIIGTIDVFYLEAKQKRDEGPFLREERELINAVAERLGRIIERKLWLFY